MRIEDMSPLPGRALVEITKTGRDAELRDDGLLVVHGKGNDEWQPSLDWEVGKVLALGEGDFEPVQVGDSVLVRAPSGGEAGVDVGPTFGRARGELIMVEAEEMLCKVE